MLGRVLDCVLRGMLVSVIVRVLRLCIRGYVSE